MRPILLIVLCCLGCACGDGSTRLCFGTGAFCEGAFGRNRPPHADAGPDLAVTAGEPVQLDGTGSDDPDGAIASYSWTQEHGPAVALENASAAVATFVAPAVADTTRLGFRLVITDGDRASDTDRLEVTVTPVAIAALARGLALLKTVHHPPPDPMPIHCPDCWPRLGLWLAARVLAAPADPDRDVLLDELRMLTLLQAASPPRSLDGPRGALYRLAQHQVAAFTRLADPATALQARQLAGAPAAPGEWSGVIATACPGLRALLTDPDRLAHWLLRVPAQAASTESVAAAIVLLAQPRHLDEQPVAAYPDRVTAARSPCRPQPR